MKFLGFVPWAEIVPEDVRWFWDAVEVGQIPFSCLTAGVARQGTLDPDPSETPFILCADDAVRVAYAVQLLKEARAL